MTSNVKNDLAWVEKVILALLMEKQNYREATGCKTKALLLLDQN